MKQTPLTRLLEDYTDLLHRLEKVPQSSNSYKVIIKALETTSKRLDVALDQVADGAKPTEILYE